MDASVPKYPPYIYTTPQNYTPTQSVLTATSLNMDETATEAFYRQIKMTMDGFGEPKYPSSSRFVIVIYHAVCWLTPLAVVIYPAVTRQFSDNLVQLRFLQPVFQILTNMD